MDIRQLVFEALTNAVEENQYDLMSWTDEAIAADLVTCDADLENQDPSTLVPFIQEWRAR